MGGIAVAYNVKLHLAKLGISPIDANFLDLNEALTFFQAKI